MGSVIGKRAKALMAGILSVGMVLSLNPASALTALAAEKPTPQPHAGEQTYSDASAPSNPGGTVGTDGNVTPFASTVAGSASTSVMISTYSTFQVNKYSQPAAVITMEEATAASETVPNSYYRAVYMNGAPASNGKYTATWSWTKKDTDGNDVSSAAGTLTKEFDTAGVTDKTAPAFTMTLMEGPLKALTPGERAGKYKVTLAVTGNTPAYPNPFEFAEVEVLAKENTDAQLNDEGTTGTGSVIDGGFKAGAQLYATDLLPGSGSTSSAYDVIAGSSSMTGSVIDAIWQLDAVNDTLIPSTDLVTKVTKVKMPVKDSTKGAELAKQASIKVASLVNGQVRTVAFTRTSADGVVPAVFAGTVNNREQSATVEKDAAGNWFVVFDTAGLGEFTGAFAVTSPIPADKKVVITATAENGTITPSGSTTIVKGAGLDFTMAPAEGYVLNPAPTVKVVKKNNVSVVDGWSVTGNVLSFTNVIEDLTVTVTYQKAPAATTPFDLNVNIVNETKDGKTAAGAIQVTRTEFGADAEATLELTSSNKLSNIKPNSTVMMSFGQVGTNNSVLKSVEIGKDAATAVSYEITGTSYTFTMTENTKFIRATFEPGIPPVVATQTITGFIKSGLGNFGVKDGTDIPGGTLTKVNYGDFARVTVNAATNYTISKITVVPESGGGEAWDVDLAEGATTHTVSITSVTCDYEIQATFALKGELPVDASTYTIAAGADDGTQGGYTLPAGPITVAAADGNVPVQIQPYSGYEISTIGVKDSEGVVDSMLVTNKNGQTIQLAYRKAGAYTLQIGFKKLPEDDPTKRYVLNATVSGGNGMVSPSGTQTVAKGSNQTFTVIPNDGYKLDTVLVNDNPLESVTGATFTLNDISANMNVVVKFAKLQSGETKPTVPKTANITAAAKGAGKISPAGVTSMEIGKKLTFTMTPDAGCTFKQLEVGGQIVSATSNLTYELTVAADTTVVATFADASGSTAGHPSYVTVDVMLKTEVRGGGENLSGKVVSAGGKVSNNGNTITIPYGDSVDFVIMPDDGYYAARAYYIDANGVRHDLTIRPLSERNASAKTRSVTIPASGLSALPSFDLGDAVAGLLGIEKAYAATTVQKPYSFVTIPDITGPITLYVEFEPCEKDPENKTGAYYSYSDQRDDVVTFTPSGGGGVTTSPSLSDIVIDVENPSPTHTTEINLKPADGEKITDVTIAGKVFPPADMPDSKKQEILNDPKKFAEEFNKWAKDEFGTGAPTLTPTTGSDGKPDGGYKLDVSDKFIADNKDAIKDVIKKGGSVIGASGSGATGEAYIYDVSVDINESVGGTIYVIRNGNENKKYGHNDKVPMNYKGILTVVAQPNPGYTLKVDKTGGVEDYAAPAALASLDDEPISPKARAGSQVRQSYLITKGGSIKASFVSALTANTYSVTTVVNGKGSISPSGTMTYNINDASPVFTITPDTNYQIKSIKINGAEQRFSGNTFVFPEKRGGTAYTLEVTFGTSSSPGYNGPLGSGIKTLQYLAQTGDLQMPLILVLSAVACAALGVAILNGGRKGENRRRRSLQA